MRARRRVNLIVASLAAGCVVAPATAQAQPRTAQTIFQAFHSDGRPAIATRPTRGSCFSGSDAIDRDDAWRCTAGNDIYDPCFSSSRARSIVVCPDAALTAGVALRLSKPLPRRYADHGRPSLAHQPWNVELADGRHCILATGASTIIDRQRLNYFCGAHDNVGLWGFPSRRTQPWSILAAPFTAKRLDHRVGLRHVWM